MLPHTVGYIFDLALHAQPEATAILQGEVTWTYAALDARLNRMANALRDLGVRSGERVALLFGNDVRYLEALLGSMRLGAVPVPLNIRMGDDPLTYIIDDAEAQVLIAGRSMVERACKLAVDCANLRQVLLDAPPRDGHLSYDQVMQAASEDFPRPRLDPDAVCMQPYTSGSTGRPKGVLLSHRGQIWNADIVRKFVMLDATERGIVAVPLYHKNAMIGAVKPLLLAGGSFVILPGFDPVQVIEAVYRHQVTYITGVPAMYKMMLAERATLQRANLRSLRFSLVGSAEVPEELLDAWVEATGAPMAESYGLTEGGPVPTMNLRHGIHKRGSCGVVVPDCEVKLTAPDDPDTEVSCGEVGELVVRNPGLATGYWKLPQATREKFRNGWLYTGDLMRRDQDGYYYFVGRKDDMMNVSGENVYPKEVEEILLQHPEVQDACVVPVDHPTKTMIPVAYLVVRQGAELDEKAVQEFYFRRGTPYAYPRRVLFLGAMPLSGTGKTDRSALKAAARKAVDVSSL